MAALRWDIIRVFTSSRMAVVFLLGFSSGLPLALTATTLQAWMKKHDIIQKTARYEDLADFSLQDGYPGYPGWEKSKK